MIFLKDIALFLISSLTDTWLGWPSSDFPWTAVDRYFLRGTHTEPTQDNIDHASAHSPSFTLWGFVCLNPLQSLLSFFWHNTTRCSSVLPPFWTMALSLLFITVCSSAKSTLQNCSAVYGAFFAFCSTMLPLQVDNIICVTLSLICNVFSYTAFSFFFCRTVA